MFEHLIVVVLLIDIVVISVFFVIQRKRLRNRIAELLDGKVSNDVKYILEKCGYDYVDLFVDRKFVNLSKIDRFLELFEKKSKNGLDDPKSLGLSVMYRMQLKAEMYYLGFIDEHRKIQQETLELLSKLQDPQYSNKYKQLGSFRMPRKEEVEELESDWKKIYGKSL